jgi:parallel beta-helix repeat protein
MVPEILDNTIIGNRAQSGDGGGVYIVTAFDGTIIRGNWIQDNYAGDHGGGIAVAGAVPVEAEISENILWNNIADGVEHTAESGGGIWLQNTNAWVHHNTIVQSTGNGSNNTYGGGIALNDAGSPLIEQNILVLSFNGGGILCRPGVTPTLRNNLGWQNLPVEGVGLCSTWWQSDGNVLADPMFCDLGAGVFTVGDGSPALIHPAGPLGAFPNPGCQPILVQQVTWGGLKARFGDQ